MKSIFHDVLKKIQGRTKEMRYDRHEDRRSSTTPYSREAKKPRLNTSGKEETCRTLFIRNVSFSATERDVVSLFEPFGQIKQTFSLIEKRGLIFITFVWQFFVF